ncbi:MAG: ATP-binding cassette domain-containing protein [Pseudomonadales bacterium]|nr:ATP-binding cassette domain-containing protein [Pseudomonadales bacterium]
MILAQGISKHYGALTAVDGLSLDIPAGQFFGLLGPNGSGKTTTIHMLATLLAPSAGSILIDGLDITKDPLQARKKIGLVFQDSSLDGTLSVEQNLLFCAGLQGLSLKASRERLQELLPLFDLQDRRHAPVASLSGGMRRAVDILRGIVHRPRVLFLDEPTVGLDLPSRKRIWHFVRRQIAEHGMTVVLTTHYLEEAAPCDQVCFIRQGQAIARGNPDALVHEFGDRILEIEASDIARLTAQLHLKQNDFLMEGNTLLVRERHDTQVSLEEIQQQLAQQVETLRIRKPNLNDVFLWLTSGTAEEKTC